LHSVLYYELKTMQNVFEIVKVLSLLLKRNLYYYSSNPFFCILKYLKYDVILILIYLISLLLKFLLLFFFTFKKYIKNKLHY
jgi:hypothetical protein